MTHSQLLRRPAQRLPVVASNAPAFSALTMSSREIADMTGKDISHIHRDIRSMLAGLVGEDDPELDHVREDKDGRGYTTQFHLPRELTLTLVAGYSVLMRRRIVARWQELERGAGGSEHQFRVPATMAEALRLAAEQAEEIERQQVIISSQAPQVGALHRIALTPSDATLCMTDAAKHLQIRPQKLFSWLENNGWAHRRTEGGHLVAYQVRIDRGYLVHKLVEYKGSGGAARQQEQVRVTHKGLAKLAHLMAQGKGPK